MKSSTAKWLFAIVICLPWAYPGNGQTIITGQILESQGLPFPFVNVLLLNGQDSAMVKGMLTNEQGNYRFENIKPGQYLIAASMVGHHKLYSPAFVINPQPGTYQVKNLWLSEANQQLKQVEVVAQKPLFEQHLDRLVINVQSSITAGGATALDVLERSPGITLNRQSNTLSINGKDGVVVMINGKISRVPIATVLQVLGGMNAGNLDKIEIITTPSAQYDAEGNAGVLNLIMKKSQELGTNGSYTATLGYGWYEKMGGSGNLNHRTEKINFYTDYSFSRNHAFNQIRTNRQANYQNNIISTTTLNRRQPVRHNHTARIGFDYPVSTRTTLSGLLAGFTDKFDLGPATEKGSSETYRNNTLQARTTSSHQEINLWRHLMGNLNLTHKLTEKQEISLDMDYLYYHDYNPHQYINTFTNTAPPHNYTTQIDMKKNTPIWLWVGKADYRNTLKTGGKLEAGFKSTLSRLENKVVVQDLIEQKWQPNQEFSQHIQMQENIGAAYVNLNHQFPQKIKLQTGLRYEFTHTNLTTIDHQPIVERRYGNLFPSIFASHDFTPKRSVQASYSRRITRPTYNNLAPFVYFIDPNTFLSGNTNLRPVITDAFLTTYRFRESYLFSLGYSYDKTPIVAWQIHQDPATNKQYARAENLIKAQNYSFNFSLPFNATSWWQIQSNLLGVWVNNLGLYDGRKINLQGGFAQINVNQTFRLPHNFTAEITGQYQSRAPFGIAYTKAFGALNAGLQKKLNHHGVLRLTVDDIFWTMRFKILMDQPTLNLYAYFNGAFSDPRVVRLTYAHSFGNQKLKAAQRRETSSEEERRRANTN